jgi:hypothetical protein
MLMGTPALVPAVFYPLTLQKALGRCSQQGAHNVSRIGLADVAPWVRICDPFILVINILINIVINIAKSLGNEFARRGIANADREPGTLGLR